MEDAKTALRRDVRRLRTGLSSGSEGAERCLRMQGRLMQSRLWKESRRVLLYAAAKGEADASHLIEAAWSEGREVFLPRCRPGEPGMMDFILFREGDALRPSAFGIPEPELAPQARMLREEELMEGQGTLIVVPALAFDRSGFRLGYGGGYYDRLLVRARCASVGLAFHRLLFDTLPRDAWDRPVRAVCTEEILLCL